MSNDNNKRILVMMSTYNGEKHLSEQIESILNQKTIHEVHLRIRDDGSKDNTCKLINEFVNKYPSQIEFIKGDNLGYNGSFFALINSAKDYDYYSISDQDDVWLEDKLQIACDAIDGITENIPVLYASTSFLVHDDLVPYGTTRKKTRDLSIYNTIIQNICPGHSQVFNNALLELLKFPIDVNKIYVYDSWIQNIANIYGKIIFDNEAHTYYRQYEGNQLGSGAGKIGQLLSSLKRNKNSDGLKYRGQITYFLSKNIDAINNIPGFANEINSFALSTSFGQRCRFAIKTKFYRQSSIETLVWKIAVIFGKF